MGHRCSRSVRLPQRFRLLLRYRIPHRHRYRIWRICRDYTRGDLPPLLTREDNHLFFRVSVLSPARIGKNGPSGPVMSPVSLFRNFSDRPVSGVFAGSLTGNPALGPVCLSGDFARRKTGLFRACLNRGLGGEMRFGLWRGVIRGPAATMGVLEGFGVLRRRILRILLILVVLTNHSHVEERDRSDTFIGSSPSSDEGI
jgi:hypothetical protein